MCTALHFSNGENFFGRNMDIGYNFGEKAIVVPRNFPITYKAVEPNKAHFAMIGIGCVIDNYPLFAEAINEKGLGVAGLNFPNNAYYSSEIMGEKVNITPYELILYILSSCETVDNARKLLESISFYGKEFKEGLALAPLHFMISDKKSSIVVENMKTGLYIYENPVGVMTNNPPFDFHLQNLSNFINVSPFDYEGKDILGFCVKPVGHGTGGIGLAGDTSSTSRFIKCVFAKASSICEEIREKSVGQFFHILETVAVPKGFARTKDGLCDYTTYISCYNQDEGILYYKTYENSQITAVKLFNEDLSSESLKTFELITNEQIAFEN